MKSLKNNIYSLIRRQSQSSQSYQPSQTKFLQTYTPHRTSYSSSSFNYTLPKIKTIQNNRLRKNNQSINKIKLIRQFIISNGKTEKKSWTDLWINHFYTNFIVYSKLIDMYMNFDNSSSSDNNDNSIQPDAYYRFFQEQIHKQFIKAFTSCGMIDMLYRSFYTHLTIKTNTQLMKDDQDINNYKFLEKLPQICMAAQMIYTYPLLVDRNNTIELNDNFFQIRLETSANYVNDIF